MRRILVFLVIILFLLPASFADDVDNSNELIQTDNNAIGSYGKITIIENEPIKNTSEKISLQNEVKLKSRKFIPKKTLDEKLKAKIKSREKTHVLIQFETIPTKEEKKELHKEGIKLLSYIPDNAWFASVSGDVDEKLDKLKIRAVVEILSDDKISKAVANGNFIINNDRTVNLSVIFYDDVDLDVAAVMGDYSGIVDKYYSSNSIKVAVRENRISAIAEDENVQWIDVADKINRKLNDGTRVNMDINSLQTVPYSLSGEGVVMAQWDGGWADISHDDLQGRVTIGDSGCSETYCSTADHATHVAGTMLGNGTINWTYRGMAPKAKLVTYEWWDDNTELNNEHNQSINTYNASISQNSWGYKYISCGSDCFGGYDSATAELDEVVRGSLGETMTIVYASGNDRDDGCDNGVYDCIGFPGAGKNTISVGGINSDDDSMTLFSSWGPTNDGRLKPEIVAPGCEDDVNRNDDIP